MQMSTSLIQQLITALRVLPGVGPKSAQRMVYHLLERNRPGARVLADKLVLAMEKVAHCEQCRTFTERKICELCSNTKRNRGVLCVVESPADVSAIEQSATYSGLYFVLMGHLSPLDGIGPEDIGIELLAQRFAEGEVQEVILATNSNVEGEATAHFIAELARRHQVKCTRIAQGVPLGGELEYLDGGTLAHALVGRREI